MPYVYASPALAANARFCRASSVRSGDATGSGGAKNAVFVRGQPLDGDPVSWLEVMMLKEGPPGTTAAEGLLVGCDVGFYRAGKACEVQGEQRAGPVPRVGGADRVGGEEAQVRPEIDMAVAEVALGELDHDACAAIIGGVRYERRVPALLDVNRDWVRCGRLPGRGLKALDLADEANPRGLEVPPAERARW